MLMTAPHPHTHPHPIRWLHHRWARLIIAICSGFHLGMALVLAFAPPSLVLTDGALPVFSLMGRHAWAIPYAVAGVAAALLVAKTTLPRMICTWGTVVPLGFAWTGTWAVAAAEGRGSAIALMVWPTLLAVFVTAGMWLATHEALRTTDEG